MARATWSPIPKTSSASSSTRSSPTTDLPEQFRPARPTLSTEAHERAAALIAMANSVDTRERVGHWLAPKRIRRGPAPLGVTIKSFRKHDGSMKLNLDLHDIYTVVMRSSPRFARSSTKRSLIRLG